MDIKTFFRPGREDFTKETTLYFILALCFIAVALSALAFYLYYVVRGTAETPRYVQKTLQEKQFEELARQTRGLPSYTQAEIEQQIKDLNAASQKYTYNQEQINKQFEELNKASK